MAVAFGKPGSIRYRGRMRAQMQRVVRELASLLAYNVRLGARVPPVPFLQPGEVAQINIVSLLLQQKIAAKN